MKNINGIDDMLRCYKTFQMSSKQIIGNVADKLPYLFNVRIFGSFFLEGLVKLFLSPYKKFWKAMWKKSLWVRYIIEISKPYNSITSTQ